jgi:hypothetical protein
MKYPNRDEVSRLVEAFLNDHPRPTTADWKILIDAHPGFASDIANAALLYTDVEDLESEARARPLNQAAFDKTISLVLNRVYETPSPLIKEAKARVDAIKGPAVKSIAVELGIGPYPSLLNGILVGRTSGPRHVMRALSDKWNIAISTLSELFNITFQNSEVAATERKPQLSLRPASWEEAVRALNLSPEETNRLLKLDDEV